MSHLFLLSCEHGGNNIPDEFMYLFAGNEDILFSHNAIDLGALRLAKLISSELKLPLHYTTISRLLVEFNRSPDEEELFCEYVKAESEQVKRSIMEKYYWPHRKKVEDEINNAIAKGYQVIHVGVHTFAPVMEGEVRKTDIGILLDPKRSQELAFGKSIIKECLSLNPHRQIDINLPYPGTDDCFQRFLSQRISADDYLGIEIEVNQKFFLDGEPGVWESIAKEVTSGLQKTIDKWQK